MRAVVRSAVIFVLAVATPVLAVGVATAQTPIAPGQHFVGLVNGSTARVRVYTACADPPRKGREGPVVAGQTMSVAEVARGHGATGLFSQIYAWFVPRHHATPVELTFSSYGEPQTIPSSVWVPCTGHGRAEFSSCPYLAPCAAGWTPTYVRVTFVDVAD